MNKTKPCIQCGTMFEKPYTCSRKDWKSRKFCSVECKHESQKGKDPWNKGMSFPSQAQKIPCRICGKPTKYSGTEANPSYDMVHCGRPKCAKESRAIKNNRISQRAIDSYANGDRKPATHAWDNVPQVSSEEIMLSPWLQSLGWITQYKFLTGVHTNKLPRMFRLDFALPEHNLYIEIDGSVHRLRKERDARRDRMMAERGWIGLRIKAELVRNDLGTAKQTIMRWIDEHLPGHQTAPEKK